MPEELEFIKADKSRIDIALDLLKEAALWLGEKKIDYWQEWINPSERSRNWVKQGFDFGQFYFTVLNNEVVGMFSLRMENELVWGKRANKIGYVHAFTTKRAYAGKGLGKRILDKIADECRKKGLDFIRLDCGAEVLRLRKYYEDYGFKFIREKKVKGYNLAFYELKI